jgi:hypothetical protein
MSRLEQIGISVISIDSPYFVVGGYEKELRES